MMKMYQASYFSARIPDEWDAEFDDDEGVDVIYNENGHGEIQISGVIHETQLSSNDLMHIAEEDLHAGAKLQEMEPGPFNGFWFDYEADGEYWCEWYLCKGRLMLFATYNCAVENEGKEFSDIDLIMRTLQPAACADEAS